MDRRVDTAVHFDDSPYSLSAIVASPISDLARLGSPVWDLHRRAGKNLGDVVEPKPTLPPRPFVFCGVPVELDAPTLSHAGVRFKRIAI